MNDIQLVLTDVDGTVADFGKHMVSDVVRSTVIACENKGIRVVPVTGRYYHMALPVLELLGFEDVGIFDNGATIQDCKTGEIIWSKWMDSETIKRVAKIFEPHAAIIDYTEEHDEHEPASNESDLIEAVERSASHVYALIPIDKLEEVRSELDKIANVTYYTAVSTRPNFPDARGIQVNLVGADKFHGVNALRDILRISKEHTLAIGDGDNDVTLFDNARVKVAMGNATEVLKEKADHIVASLWDDGFAQAMDEFVIVD